MSEAQAATLPTGIALDDEQQCPICQSAGTIDDPLVASMCGSSEDVPHVFHMQCIVAWFESKKKAVCPVCRRYSRLFDVTMPSGCELSLVPKLPVPRTKHQTIVM